MCILTEEEFERKYHLYSQELMDISFGYTRNKDDSLDIIQNVFYKFFKINKKFPTILDEKYWLIRITINESIDFLRKRKRTILLDEVTINSFLNNQAESEDNLRLIKISEVVESLKEKYRVVIILYYYDSLQIKDIAKVLNIKEDAVKKRLERARKMIKEEMEEF